ncbi:MAG: type II/IV secretion system protein [Kiritimatiellae bacterium]|nr:type II/IV secretion system protein [Kiritimatiellia bacterium]
MAGETFIGKMLLRTGMLSEPQVSKVLEKAPETEGGIPGAAVAYAGVSEEAFLRKVAEMLGMPFVALADINPDKDAIAQLPSNAVYQYNVAPVKLEGGALLVATSDPFNTAMADGLRLAVDVPVRLAVATREDIAKAAKKAYGFAADTIDQLMASGEITADLDTDFSKTDLSELGQEASIVRFVNQVIAEADRQGATDIHFEPMEDELRIRYRIDGMLHKVEMPPQLNRLQAAITSRLKVMANLDIAEKRLPMDGRIGIRVNGEDIDIRVSTMPTAYGESVSLRLLQKSGSMVKLGDLGMQPDDQALIEKLIHRPNGIILVTGPTGSGKSTSLYSFLHEINRMDVRILTAEDPIEYEMPGINQVAVRSDIGLTFARILRSFLRQDPDICMVGEIRDAETAEIAINASLTGHLVLSTLHTNDSAGAFARLIDMGVEPFLVASAVSGVLAQRLIRRLCTHCRREETLTERQHQLFKLPDTLAPGTTIYEPAGCERCGNTGYKGRGGIFELLHVTEAIESMIIGRKSSAEIRRKAIEQGMHTLRDDGWRSVKIGRTTLSEVLRVTEDSED